MDRPSLARLGLRLTLISVLMVALALAAGNLYVRAWLPLYRTTLSWLADDFRIVGPSLTNVGGQSFVRVDAILERYTVLGERVLPPGAMSITASTIAGNAIIHPLLLFGVCLVWPGLGLKGRSLALVAALPILVLIEVVDVPYVLWGSILDLIYADVAPAKTSLYAAWTDFLNGGGRVALSLTGALLAVWVGYWAERGATAPPQESARHRARLTRARR